MLFLRRSAGFLPSLQIDLIHDTRHLCTHLRTDGIKAMSRGISGHMQAITFANTSQIAVEFLYSL